jgi:carboxypeptidase family protein
MQSQYASYLLKLLGFLMLTLIFNLPLQGQGSVTIFGTVLDPSGSAIQQANVTATNTATGAVRRTTTNAAGDYVISQLPIGTYSVAVEAAGFKKFVQDNILVQVDENRQTNVQLEIGSVAESVTVSSYAAQVETRSGSIHEVIDSTRIVELPLNGRNPLQLQYLVAGIGGTVTAGQEQNDSVSINGSRPNSNNYTLDNVDNHDPYFNTPTVFPNPDALEEFSLQTSSYGADRGRNAGAVMNAVTRSGTNAVHGTLFEFVRNEKFNARNFFANSVSPFKRNQYGGTFGGPIRKNKTFFFVSYQQTAERSSPGSLNPTVLTDAERHGDFSALAKPLRDPEGGFFPNNVIPTDRLNQAVQSFLTAFVPLPNQPGARYSFASQQSIDDGQLVTKIDHALISNNRLSGRILYDRNNNAQAVNPTTLPGFLAKIEYRNWNVALTDTQIVSARMINVFTFGLNHINRDQIPIVPGNKSWTDLGAGFVRANPSDPAIGFNTMVNGYFHPQSRFPLHHHRKSFQFSDGVNWMIGSHFLKFGADVRRDLLDLQENFETDPTVVFSPKFTGNAASDFLLGLPTRFEQIAPDTNHPRTTEIAAYIQDDWKVSRRLTLNLGLRWDPYFPYSDLNNRFAQVRLGEQSTRFPTAPVGYVFPGDGGVPAATVSSRYQNWGPRFGFAFDPFGTGRTSLRGGYGIFYSQTRQQANNQISNNQPFSIVLQGFSPSGGLINPYADTGNPFPFKPPATPQEAASYAFMLPLTITQWDPNFRNAYVQQWNFTVERQFFSSWIVSAAYVGSKGNHLFLQNELNPAIYGAPGQTVDERRRLFPTFSSITDMSSTGNSNYHSLQLSANKKLTNGLTVLASYTWSKMLDDVNGLDDFAQQANPFDLRAERGLSDLDIPHRFVASFIWQLPSLKDRNGWVRNIAGDWEINGIATLQSQAPFSVTTSTDNSGSGLFLDRADLVGDAHISGDRSKQEIIQEAFNTAAFAPNAPGTFGNSGRNILRGEFQEYLDLGIVKAFPISEHHRLQFRAEAFNLFNHSNLGNPDGGFGSPTFGQITSATAPRVLQFALKYMF